jgi:hypothetical protein
MRVRVGRDGETQEEERAGQTHEVTHLDARENFARAGRPKSKDLIRQPASLGPLLAAAAKRHRAALTCSGTPELRRRYRSLVRRDTSCSARLSNAAAVAGEELPGFPSASAEACGAVHMPRMRRRSDSNASVTPSSLPCGTTALAHVNSLRFPMNEKRVEILPNTREAFLEIMP